MNAPAPGAPTSAVAPPDALLSAAFEALQRAGKLTEPSLDVALADPLHAGVLRAYAAALAHGQQPYPPPAHVRPAVIAPEPPPLDRARIRLPRHELRPVDLKRRAAGDTDD